MKRFATTLKTKRWLQVSLLVVVLVALSGTGYLAYDRFIAHPDEYPTHHLRYALPDHWILKDPSPAFVSMQKYPNPIPSIWQPQHMIEIASPHDGAAACSVGGTCPPVPDINLSISDYLVNGQSSPSAWLRTYHDIVFTYTHGELDLSVYKPDTFAGQPAFCQHFFSGDGEDCLVKWNDRIYDFNYGLDSLSAPTFQDDATQLHALINSLQFV